MFGVITLLFIIIYATQELQRKNITKIITESQLHFSLHLSATDKMLISLEETRTKFLLRHNNSLSPVSIGLTDIELIERVKNTLQYNIQIISNLNILHKSANNILFTKKLQTEIKLTLDDLTKFQTNSNYDVNQYLLYINPLLMALKQYKSILIDEKKHHLADVESNKTQQRCLVLILILIALVIALYIISKILKLVKQSIQDKEILDDKLTVYRKQLEYIVEDRTSDLNSSLKKLEIENTERIKAESLLIKAKHIAEVANHQKSDFLNRMSHELRTPMNAILGFAQLMLMEDLIDEHKSYIKEILTAGEHLQEMIDEVLDLSKIESGNITIKNETLSLFEIVMESISLITSDANKKDITIINELDEDNDVLVWADSLRLKEVLLNLLTNAIKYNVSNGKITISQGIKNTNTVVLAVSDTGIGISNDSDSDVFEPFNRLGAEFTDVQGSGIGLSITKKLIELMGGTIGFDSVAGKGTRFWIELQLSEFHGDEVIDTLPVKTPHAIGNNKYFKIVYIEDNQANLRLVQSIISKQNNIILVSHDNGEEGIALIKNEKPDLIILDINLPGMTGFQIFDILKNDTQTQHIPVYALSASATKDDIDKALMVGFKRYLTKPINVTEFLDAITNEIFKVDK